MSVEKKAQASDNSNCNGAIMGGKYMPFELLVELFMFLDRKTLLSCQLVCKYWRDVMQSYGWRRKAEISTRERVAVDTTWMECCFVCGGQPFNRNLIRNHSGEQQLEHWYSCNLGLWQVESPPEGVPNLPDDPVFEGTNSCFATTRSMKYQMILLREEGFSEYVLDAIKPVIKVSEWYCCRSDCPSTYKFNVKLQGVGDVVHKKYSVESRLGICEDTTIPKKWVKFTTELSNYEPGVTSIVYTHGGHTFDDCEHRTGIKIAGCCVKLAMPELKTRSADSKDAESAQCSNSSS